MISLALWCFALALDTPAIPSLGDVQTAIQYGPFFFALLFLIGGATWSYRIYHEVWTRKPPALPSERRTAQRIFVGTCVVGVLLVACCVVWWWIYQPGVYVFAGEIRGLRDYEKITSTELFFKRVPVPPLGSHVPGLRDEQFVIIQSKPFRPADSFRLWFSKSDDSLEEFAIKYSPGNPKLKFEWNEKAGKNVLQAVVEPTTSGAWLPGLPDLEAATQAKVTKTKKAVAPAAKTSTPAVDPYLIRALQDERSQVGTKIYVLDRLASLDAASLGAYLKARTDKEPVAVTLVDLSRHADRELAYKAERILQKVNLDAILIGQLTASDSATRDAAVLTLLRLDPPHATKILDAAKSVPPSQIKEVKSLIAARPTPEPPIPTGSPNGDRYYMNISWNPDKPEIGRCVADGFLAGPPVEPPRIQPNGVPVESELLVFWYTKQVAIEQSERARHCGARVQFVSPAPVRRKY